MALQLLNLVISPDLARAGQAGPQQNAPARGSGARTDAREIVRADARLTESALIGRRPSDSQRNPTK